MENKSRKLHTAILAVMSKVQYLNKSQSVQNFKAVSSEKVISAVREAMIENLLTIRPLIVDPSRSHEFWDDNGKRKNQFVTHTLITFRIEHAETGEFIDFMSDGTGIDALDKAPGKALTYALKSALLSVFMIPTGHKQDVIAEAEIEQSLPCPTDAQFESFKVRALGSDEKEIDPTSFDDLVVLIKKYFSITESQVKEIKSWYND